MKRNIIIDYGFNGLIVKVIDANGKLIEKEMRGNALNLNGSIVSQHHPLHISEVCLAGSARWLAGQLCIKHAIDGYQRKEGLLDQEIRLAERDVRTASAV